MKPILFHAEMVRAILAGRKSVTRRDPFQMPAGYTRVNGLYRNSAGRLCAVFHGTDPDASTVKDVPARYEPGDILWVRETWQVKRGGGYLYKADAAASHDLFVTPDGRVVNDIPWRPSIHMPKEAARLFLRVTGVFLERIQDISAGDVLAEGALGTHFQAPTRGAFAELWDRTVKPAALPCLGWSANPWVWGIAFERISRDEAVGRCAE